MKFGWLLFLGWLVSLGMMYTAGYETGWNYGQANGIDWARLQTFDR